MNVWILCKKYIVQYITSVSLARNPHKTPDCRTYSVMRGEEHSAVCDEVHSTMCCVVRGSLESVLSGKRGTVFDVFSVWSGERQPTVHGV